MTIGHSSVSAPLVSAIVAAGNRLTLGPALRSILDQDLRDLEILVVAEDAACLDDVADNRVRLVRSDRRQRGAMRAAALDAARGRFAAYCDPDDRWTSDHLSTLLRVIESHPETGLVYGDVEVLAANGASRPPVVESDSWPDKVQAPFIISSGVLHRIASARAVGGFDVALDAYDDWDLWLRMSSWDTMRHVPAVVATRIVDGERCGADESAEAFARRRLARHLRGRSITTPLHQPTVRRNSPRSRFDPNTWQPGSRELVFHSWIGGEHSFGVVSRYLIEALERANVVPIVGPAVRNVPPDLERLRRDAGYESRLAFVFQADRLPAQLTNERIAYYGPWETALVPRDRIDDVNRHVSLVYVPCRQNQEAYVESGSLPPVRLLPHGVDPLRFPLLDRPPRDMFTFGSFGQQTPRKGIDVLVRAFTAEFKAGEPVRLLLHATSTRPLSFRRDPRIENRSGYIDHAGVIEFLRELDAFVLPSRGEGFGLGGLEAMATGLPVIATNWSGPADYLDPADGFPLDYRLVNAGGTESHGYRYFGTWAEPDERHLRTLLRWLYEHPEEARSMGRRASTRVHRDWTWDRVAAQILSDFDLLASGITPIGR